MGFFKSLFKKKLEPLIDIDTILESEVSGSEPINFVEKSVWVCIKTNDIRELLNSFQLKELKKENWIEAFNRENDDYVFTVGPIGDWVIQYGWTLIQPNYNDGMDEVHKYLNLLSSKFSEAHYYLCQQTTDTAIWVKSINGKIEKSYCIGDGIFLQSGKMTEVEKDIGINYKPIIELSDEKAEHFLLPGIEEVLRVAENWSISPNKLKANNNVPQY